MNNLITFLLIALSMTSCIESKQVSSKMAQKSVTENATSINNPNVGNTTSRTTYNNSVVFLSSNITSIKQIELFCNSNDCEEMGKQTVIEFKIYQSCHPEGDFHLNYSSNFDESENKMHLYVAAFYDDPNPNTLRICAADFVESRDVRIESIILPGGAPWTIGSGTVELHIAGRNQSKLYDLRWEGREIIDVFNHMLTLPIDD